MAHRVHRQGTAPDPGVSWPDERKNRSGQALPGRPFFARPSIIRVRLLAYQGCLSFSHFLAESFEIEFRGLDLREQLAFLLFDVVKDLFLKHLYLGIVELVPRFIFSISPMSCLADACSTIASSISSGFSIASRAAG